MAPVVDGFGGGSIDHGIIGVPASVAFIVSGV